MQIMSLCATLELPMINQMGRTKNNVKRYLSQNIKEENDSTKESWLAITLMFLWCLHEEMCRHVFVWVNDRIARLRF